ncbi:MAG: nuclear transport factor 2 family protein [Comamonadaceae bacterium]|nr:MAG: nuclear transport factor 2 family protein [Comamonadaceae bacterium]
MDMNDTDPVRTRIRDLERRRYAAMVGADADTLEALLSTQLIYAHSNGARDTKASYLAKVRNGTFTYISIDHPEERILVDAGCAVVLGRMIASASWAGVPKNLHNSSLAVWVDEGDAWRMLAYQPTPIPEH